jgi:DNA-binding GntR family transcriptional regulator
MKQAKDPGLDAIDHSDLVSRISGILTENILAGRFRAGSRLTEAQMARDLGVSRAPVREALRLIENRGLVISHPRRGFFVREIDADEYDQIYDLRMCLERHAGSLVIARLTDEITGALEAQIAVLGEVAKSGTAAKQVEEDIRFHRMLCQFSGNRRLLQVYDELASEIRLGIAMIGQLYADPEEIARTHEPILAALKSKDVAAFIEAIDYHIGVARHHVVKSLRLDRENLPL